jgi:hypothetical protein
VGDVAQPVWTPELEAEARRQSRAVARSPHATDDQAFVDAFSGQLFDDSASTPTYPET